HAGGETAETRFHAVGKAEGEVQSPRSKVQSPKAAGESQLGEASTYILVEAEPVTGRTHQIRVHAAEQGFPVLGDALYGGTPAARVFLHAAELTLTHPASGKEMTFHAPLGQGAHRAGATHSELAGGRPSAGAAAFASSGC